MLGWEARIGLDEGIVGTADWLGRQTTWRAR
jgi:hypothetical protein